MFNYTVTAPLTRIQVTDFQRNDVHIQLTTTAETSGKLSVTENSVPGALGRARYRGPPLDESNCTLRTILFRSYVSCVRRNYTGRHSCVLFTLCLGSKTARVSQIHVKRFAGLTNALVERNSFQIYCMLNFIILPSLRI